MATIKDYTCKLRSDITERLISAKKYNEDLRRLLEEPGKSFCIESETTLKGLIFAGIKFRGFRGS